MRYHRQEEEEEVLMEKSARKMLKQEGFVAGTMM